MGFRLNLFTAAVSLQGETNKSLGERDREALDLLASEGIADVTHLTPVGEGFVAELLLVNEPREERLFFSSLYGFYNRANEGAEVWRSQGTRPNVNGWMLLFRVWKGERLVGVRFDKAVGSGGYCAAGRGMGDALMAGLRLMVRYQIEKDPSLYLSGPLSPGAEACWARHGLSNECWATEALAILAGEEEGVPLSSYEEEGLLVSSKTMRLVYAWEEGQDEF